MPYWDGLIGKISLVNLFSLKDLPFAVPLRQPTASYRHNVRPKVSAGLTLPFAELSLRTLEWRGQLLQRIPQMFGRHPVL